MSPLSLGSKNKPSMKLARSSLCLLLASPCFLFWFILRTWSWTSHIHPKRLLTLSGISEFNSQKKQMFLTTAVVNTNSVCVILLTKITVVWSFEDVSYCMRAVEYLLVRLCQHFSTRNAFHNIYCSHNRPLEELQRAQVITYDSDKRHWKSLHRLLRIRSELCW
jgi:hypothetical protein